MREYERKTQLRIVKVQGRYGTSYSVQKVAFLNDIPVTADGEAAALVDPEGADLKRYLELAMDALAQPVIIHDEEQGFIGEEDPL